MNGNNTEMKTMPYQWLFNLGVRSGLPKYMTFFALLQTGVLFVPEFIWISLGLDVTNYLHKFPYFVQHYVNATSFKNTMFIFWVMSPFTILINTALCLIQVNFKGYKAYLLRRKRRLEKSGKSSDYLFALGIFLFILLYLWGTGINLSEPKVFGSFVPANNRLAMFLIHGGGISLILPLFISVIFAELRANLTIRKPIGTGK